MNEDSNHSPNTGEGLGGASSDTHERIDQAADKVKQGAGAAADATARGAHRAADAAGDAQAYAGDLFSQCCAFVREKPLESVAIAVAAGWVAGRLMAPRR